MDIEWWYGNGFAMSQYSDIIFNCNIILNITISLGTYTFARTCVGYHMHQGQYQLIKFPKERLAKTDLYAPFPLLHFNCDFSFKLPVL